MISLSGRWVGDCKVGAVVLNYRLECNLEVAGRLTGRDNKAEGESLNVFGWVSPIAELALV